MPQTWRNVMPTESGISRVTRSKQDAQAMYNKLSRWYDGLSGGWEAIAREAGLRMLNAKAGETVLELGVGTGHGLLALARAVGQAGCVYGIDLSPQMLALTQARVDRAGLAKQVHLLCGDATQLFFKSGSFNAIFMSFTLELFDTPEIPQTLLACQQALAQGGRICVVSLSKQGGSAWMLNLYEWAHRTFPKFVDCRPIFVQRALEKANWLVSDATQISLWGLPVEIVLAHKPS